MITIKCVGRERAGGGTLAVHSLKNGNNCSTVHVCFRSMPPLEEQWSRSRRQSDDGDNKREKQKVREEGNRRCRRDAVDLYSTAAICTQSCACAVVRVR